MDYMIALLVWIAEARDARESEPHCIRLAQVLNDNVKKGLEPWAGCADNKACSKALDEADDALDECPNEGW